MRKCIIETKGAPSSLVRFTEIGCLFNYNNEWLDFFQDIVLTDDADSIDGPAWRIKAGQWITTRLRNMLESTNDVDLRRNDLPLCFDPSAWSTTKEMKQYRGMKQEYIFRNYMAMTLKSRTRLLYCSNNEQLPDIGDAKEVWVPASGDMAGRLQYQNPDLKITIYDINPTQLDYSRWLNSHTKYPSGADLDNFLATKGKVSIAEKFKPGVENWVPVDAEYKLLDIIEGDLEKPTIISNILIYMPVYHKHGFAKIKAWKEKNMSLTLRSK